MARIMLYLSTITNSIIRGTMRFQLICSYSHNCTIDRSANLIRKEFLDYYAKDLKHSIIRSSPVSPITDRSLAFINAGMNQFKGIFLNYYEPPARKIANSQKCIRVGGKHNDLSIVGNDTYHHTFFEMLGNWSFGDYFKEEACTYAWHLLTNVYGIPKDYLYVTYFGGNEELGIKPDLECKDIWLRLGIPGYKVLPFGIRDNFWEMGVSGPCGPCTEIHVDYMKRSTNQAMRVNKGYEDLMELWNIVFIQYERLTNGSLVPLPKHHVDTGMGLERLVTFLQGKRSNYDTDLFQPLFNAIQTFSNAPEYTGTFGTDNAGQIDYGYRILADHTRMISVSLADNMLPEQHPKLRRILRNAIDIGERIFKSTGIVAELAYNVADNLGDAYPELRYNLKQVRRIIEYEEDLFKKLRNTSGKMWSKMVKTRPELATITDWMAPGLLDGYKDLYSMLNELRETNVLPGIVAFKLYDTYGLNPETIAELAQIESLYFDVTDFENQLDNRRYRSRLGLSKHNTILSAGTLQMLEDKCIPKTDDSFKYIYTFKEDRYEFPALKSKLIGFIINGDLVLLETSNIATTSSNSNRMSVNIEEIIYNTNEIGMILDKTVCYSLEGGQTSDKGNIHIKDLLFNVHNVRKINDYVIHYGHFVKRDLFTSDLDLQAGDNCLIDIEEQTRIGAMRHHTAAHLLNGVMKLVLDVVYQRNCTVNSDSLKFQFNSFGEQFTSKQMKIIEDCINDIIHSYVPVTVRTLNSLELLKQDDIALIPGEIYPHTGIRIVEIGIDETKRKSTNSNLEGIKEFDITTNKFKEACCGTHVHNTGELQQFYFLTSNSKGTRSHTVKAVVGPDAVRMKRASEELWHEILEIENALQKDEFTYKRFDEEINRLEQRINNSTRDVQTPLPYLVKEECLTYLENIRKTAWRREKEIEKTLITRKMTDAIDPSYRFIVYCLNEDPTYLSLHEIVSLFSDMPVFILSHSKRSVKARCSIPQEMASNAFNAQIWMDTVLKVFKAEHGSIRGSKSTLTASMKSKRIPEDGFQSCMKEAITEATKFVCVQFAEGRICS